MIKQLFSLSCLSNDGNGENFKLKLNNWFLRPDLLRFSFSLLLLISFKLKLSKDLTIGGSKQRLLFFLLLIILLAFQN